MKYLLSALVLNFFCSGLLFANLETDARKLIEFHTSAPKESSPRTGWLDDQIQAMLKHGIPSELIEDKKQFKLLSEHLFAIKQRTDYLSVKTGVTDYTRYITFFQDCWDSGETSYSDRDIIRDRYKTRCQSEIRKCEGATSDLLYSILLKLDDPQSKKGWHARELTEQERFFAGVDLLPYLKSRLRSTGDLIGTFGPNSPLNTGTSGLGGRAKIFSVRMQEGVSVPRMAECNSYYCKIAIGTKAVEDGCRSF